MGRRILNDQPFGFDKVIDLYNQSIPLSDEWASEIEPIMHLKRLVGQIMNDMDAGDGKVTFEFYRDNSGTQLVGKIESSIDAAIHNIDIIPFADYLVVIIENNDSGEAHTVSLALAGFQ